MTEQTNETNENNDVNKGRKKIKDFNLESRLNNIKKARFPKVKKFFRNVLYTGIVLGGVSIGSYFQPIEHVEDFMIYHNMYSEKGSPSDYQNWEVKKVINENHKVELYLGNKETNSYMLINEDGTVGILRKDTVFLKGEKSFGNYVDDYVDGVRDEVGGKFHSVRNYLKSKL